MGKIISFCNQKGGVGKTTSAVNIAASLGILGYKVLMIDLDPQGNATSGAGIPKKTLKLTINDVLTADVPMSDVIMETEFDNLDLVPTNIALAGAEFELFQHENSEYRLKEALAPVLPNYDYVIIDSPPLLLVSDALAIANEVDGTVLVCRHNASYVSDVKSALAKLDFIKCNILGVVVNDYFSKEKMYSRSNRYKYYSYSYHYGVKNKKEE